MSARTELFRVIPVPGPLALEAMLAILSGLSHHEAPYGEAALSVRFDQIHLPAIGDVAVPIAVASQAQPQRYECELTITATAAAGLFPRFVGSFSISPMRDSGSELWLQGTYTPPLGVVGEFVDATFLRGAADASLQRLVTWLAEEIVARVDRQQRADLRNR
jgi:hypothetical protein